MRTEAEIHAEIEVLRNLLPLVPIRSALGDSNHGLILAQIETLELGGSTWPDKPHFPPRTKQAIRRTLAWLLGETENKPSDGWNHYVTETKYYDRYRRVRPDPNNSW